MKVKMLYFLLGAVVATLAYIAGNSNLTAENTITKVEYLRVTKAILVGEANAETKTAIGPGVISVAKGDKIKGALLVNEKGVPILATEVPGKLMIIGIGDDGKPVAYFKDGAQTKIITAGN